MKTQLNEVYTTTLTNISNEDIENLDETFDNNQHWGKGGTTTQLINITIVVEYLIIMDLAHDLDQRALKYYVD